ncbi:mitotic spindle assembly checkpoint protein MAD2A isoform X1 [Hydra vulgaris]|uniref:mitotic spindle assembly checkpoint protein MAD2A isoform X1 n=1 Tax=Hydra vulgaris TaxID=6087 RepID=UPI0006412B81|nr:mitotic spindle assembly checkpoint protein MAD2A [Hydra vulgaris]
MPVSVAQISKSDAITLKGSAEMIGDFLNYSVNSILYQRLIYPSDNFSRQPAYGVPVFMIGLEKVKDYIDQFVSQLKVWLLKKTIQKVVLIITSLETNEDIEKWQFKIECNQTADESTSQISKPLKDIQKEMRDVLRQIVSSVTFLPNLHEKCMFNILAYTDLDCTVPAAWEDGCEHVIEGAQQVKLKTVNTLLHKVDLEVCYKTT